MSYEIILIPATTLWVIDLMLYLINKILSTDENSIIKYIPLYFLSNSCLKLYYNLYALWLLKNFKNEISLKNSQYDLYFFLTLNSKFSKKLPKIALTETFKDWSFLQSLRKKNSYYYEQVRKKAIIEIGRVLNIVSLYYKKRKISTKSIPIGTFFNDGIDILFSSTLDSNSIKKIALSSLSINKILLLKRLSKTNPKYIALVKVEMKTLGFNFFNTSNGETIIAF